MNGMGYEVFLSAPRGRAMSWLAAMVAKVRKPRCDLCGGLGEFFGGGTVCPDCNGSGVKPE